MNWELFCSVYVLIFLAELPDKTAFATLLLAGRSQALAVFAGVAVAFMVQCLVALLFGSIIALLPASAVHAGAGFLFLFFSYQMWSDRNAEPGDEPETDGTRGRFWIAAWQAFLVIFIAEWGDLTQIATATLVAKYQEFPWTVFWASLLALWSVTALAVILGKNAKHLIKPKQMKKVCMVLFLGLGIYFILTAFSQNHYVDGF